MANISGEQLQRNLRKAITELEATRHARAQSYASDLTDRIKQRVIQTGVLADGSTHTYSPFTQTLKKKSGRTTPPFPTINFRQTGRMWNNTRGVAGSGNPVPIFIGPSSADNVEKLAKNEARFGPIVEINEEEEAKQATLELNKITRVLRKYNVL